MTARRAPGVQSQTSETANWPNHLKSSVYAFLEVRHNHHMHMPLHVVLKVPFYNSQAGTDT